MADAENAAVAQNEEQDVSDQSSEEDWSIPTRGDGDEPAQPKVKEYDIDTLEGDEKDLAGDVVPIQFKLPNGETPTRKYFMGHTIADLKGQLEDLYGLAYHTTTLKLNGKMLIDPLSLNDLPFKARELNVVDVEVE